MRRSLHSFPSVPGGALQPRPRREEAAAGEQRGRRGPLSAKAAKLPRPESFINEGGDSFEGKVEVILGPYSQGSISVAGVPSPKVDEAMVDKALATKKATTTKFERINFTGSGAKKGHTVNIEMEAKYGRGDPKQGLPVPGTKVKGFKLELKDAQPEPWKQFVSAIVEKGMGQMEQKSFPVTFPGDYKKADFAGKTVDFTVLVLEIGVTKPVEADPRPDTEQREELASSLREQKLKASHEVIDREIKASLLKSSVVDTASKTKSVTWAKFGPESEKAMKWNFILEEVSRQEGIPFAEVMPFLRSRADLQYASS